jgi:hypothetical protein
MDPAAQAAAGREHVRAIQTIRWWRSLFVLLAIVAPLVHAFSWGAVRWWGVLDSDVITANMETAAGKEVGSTLELRSTAAQWETWLRAILPLSEFIGRLAVILLAITLLLSALVILTGGLPGVSSMIRAFFVTIIVCAMFIPWERLSEKDAYVPGVFTTLDKLKQSRVTAMQKSEDTAGAATQPVTVLGRNLGPSSEWNVALDTARFAALPFFAVLFLMIAGGGSGRAFRLATERAGGGIPMKVV